MTFAPRAAFAVFASVTAATPLSAAETEPRLWLPSIFGDHMVVTEDFAVWGLAEPGAEVTVFVKPDVGPDAVAIDVGRSATADAEGRWRVDCGGPLGGTMEVRVYAGDESVTFSDVLVGDVWLCGGQSNMAWPLMKTDDAADAIAAAERPQIRLFQAARTLADEPAEDIKGEWVVCTPETATRFSAVGYHFGRAVHEQTGRPIGLISSNWGGTPAEGWTPAEKLAGLGIDDDLAALTRVAKATPRRRSQAPSKLFNGMIAPLAPFGLTGAIWYQGENNVPRAANYDRVMRALIGSWRDAFETPDLPFLFVQLTGYDAWAKTNAQRVKAGEDPRPKPEGYVDPWPALRAAQAATSGLAGTGMAVTIDVGNETDIHPRNKRPVGERLALLARRIAYGDESVVAEGPTPVDAWTDGPRVTISFGDGGGGLRAGPEGGGRMIGGFELAGDDGVFRPARASLGYANSVNVRSDDVARPTRVRYAWADMPKGANLFGGTGLPAGPFELAVRPQTPPAVPEQSSLWLPSIFGDHMVVTEDFAVWGRSEPGAEVTVFVKPDVGPDAVTIDVGRSATADSEGRWRVDCGGLVGETVEMRVYAGDESVTFTDVLVGDVWLCGGQSNMEWSLARVHGGDRSKYGELLDDHDGHEIRLFTVRNAVSTTPAADVEGEWVVCDADTAENFSAVGYHFGVGVAEATGRPVGLISSNWGGSPVEFWTPASTLRELGRPVTEPAPTTKPNHRASQGFNAMIAPLLPLTLTGVAWYQGESNAGRAEQYESTFRAMIGSWRDAFADPDLPFLFVQLTGYDVPDDRSADGRWPELRAAQAAVLDLPATGMAVIYDVGAADNIHPPDKKTVGDRLALQARKLVYGDAEVIADGPTAVEVEFAGEAVTIRFDNSAGGLRDDCPTGCGSVEGFEVAGVDGVWRPADVTVLDEDTLEVSAFDIEEPVSLRYAWADFPGDANLYGGTGLPAWPFTAEK